MRLLRAPKGRANNCGRAAGNTLLRLALPRVPEGLRGCRTRPESHSQRLEVELGNGVVDVQAAAAAAADVPLAEDCVQFDCLGLAQGEHLDGALATPYFFDLLLLSAQSNRHASICKGSSRLTFVKSIPSSANLTCPNLAISPRSHGGLLCHG